MRCVCCYILFVFQCFLTSLYVLRVKQGSMILLIKSSEWRAGDVGAHPLPDSLGGGAERECSHSVMLVRRASEAEHPLSFQHSYENQVIDIKQVIDNKPTVDYLNKQAII